MDSTKENSNTHQGAFSQQQANSQQNSELQYQYGYQYPYNPVPYMQQQNQQSSYLTNLPLYQQLNYLPQYHHQSNYLPQLPQYHPPANQLHYQPFQHNIQYQHPGQFHQQSYNQSIGSMERHTSSETGLNQAPNEDEKVSDTLHCENEDEIERMRPIYTYEGSDEGDGNGDLKEINIENEDSDEEDDDDEFKAVKHYLSTKKFPPKSSRNQNTTIIKKI